MGGVGVVILIVYIIYSRTGSRKGGDYGDKPVNCLGNLAAVWIVLFVLSIVITQAQSRTAATVFMFPFAILAFPSAFSRATAYFGWVKSSYYLGGISYLRFRRSPFSGALLRGVQATFRLRPDAAKRAALLWLKSRVVRNKGRIYSGEMVMVVIIDALSSRPGDAKYLADRLDLLEGIGQASIPPAVSVLAVKLVLTPALSERNWPEVRRLAAQWNTPARNAIAKYVLVVYVIDYLGSSLLLRLEFWYRWLFVFGNKYLRSLSKQMGADAKPTVKASEKGYTIADLWAAEEITTAEAQTFRDQLTGQGQKSHWRKRAKKLGVWKEAEAWKEIVSGVDRCIAHKSEEATELDELQYQRVEQLHKNLHYVCESVSRRLESPDKAHGAQDFSDWLRIKHLLHELRIDEVAHRSAFDSNHALIWNWVVHLWNERKERCLAHYIAGVCAPMAMKCGHVECHDVLHGIITGKFR